MGRGIDSYIKEQFGIAEVDIRTYSPLTLAYIGDGSMISSSVLLSWEKGIPERENCTNGPARLSRAHTQVEMME